MLLTYTGRKSGRNFTTPVNYVCDGDDLLCVGSREHTWWRNLCGGARVVVRVRGLDLRGTARVSDGEAAEGGLVALLQAVPAYRRYWKVELGEDGQPKDRRDLRRVVAGNAVIKIEELEPAGGIRSPGVEPSE